MFLLTNVYPHEGSIKLDLIDPTATPPYVVTSIPDQNLSQGFWPYQIDLNTAFHDGQNRRF